MGRLTTLLCIVTGMMTIVDVFSSNRLFSTWLSENFAKTAAGYRISPGLNFLVIVSLGALIWLVTGSDAPQADAAAAKKLWRLRNVLAAAAMAAWLIFGPSIRRGRAVPAPAASPTLEQAPYFPSPLGKRR
ncbi:MAG TPA: hypothetical protein VMV10_32655 [Pirellulales bacterium]|nr:hypothetical protein [Pirellulales bacterium]